MPTIATALARSTFAVNSGAQARAETLGLYRRFIRGVPEMVKLYEPRVSAAVIKSKIRQEFERNRYVNDLPVVSVLLAKGQMEYQETMNFWKQTAQFYKYFRQEEHPELYAKKSFVDKFLDGTA
ncbi:subunit NB4M of protein NADH:Ubiquinone oxidoreductase [Dipodascopsis tothii]|uniref:subunit NB4M of protein NADH:Ubiquinone oxidoreductase n=1 Tax=Dipodascopsis tothii TaxID=44089 RepID=UPI0034CD82C7